APLAAEDSIQTLRGNQPQPPPHASEDLWVQGKWQQRKDCLNLLHQGFDLHPAFWSRDDFESRLVSEEREPLLHPAFIEIGELAHDFLPDFRSSKEPLILSHDLGCGPCRRQRRQ